MVKGVVSLGKNKVRIIIDKIPKRLGPQNFKGHLRIFSRNVRHYIR